jgi:hypothetical protein
MKIPQIESPNVSLQLLPWRDVDSDDGCSEVWTRFNPNPGSMNNYAVAIGIQDRREAARIALCVNACAGIPDAHLAGPVQVVTKQFLAEAEAKYSQQQVEIRRLRGALDRLERVCLTYGGEHPRHDALNEATAHARGLLGR